jgi:Na+/melibiose symporter-like transporter
MLMHNVNGLNSKLAEIASTMPLAFLDGEFATIEGQIVQLKKQSPYTLLMMRVVEIGLPVLLSIFAIFFVMRYSLTEKRSHEIKELLRQRSLENGGGSSGQPSVV